MAPFYGLGSTASRLQSHLEGAVYFLPLSMRIKSAPFCSDTLCKNWSFPSRISSVNVTKSTRNCNLITFTKVILNGKLNLPCSGNFYVWKFHLYSTMGHLYLSPIEICKAVSNYPGYDEFKLISFDSHKNNIQQCSCTTLIKGKIYLYTTFTFWNHFFQCTAKTTLALYTPLNICQLSNNKISSNRWITESLMYKEIKSLLYK